MAYKTLPEDFLNLKAQGDLLRGDLLRHENIGHTLDNLNVFKNIPHVDAKVHFEENFKNDINIERLKSFQNKPGDE